MLSTKAIEPNTLELLRKLQSIKEFDAFRLAGGTSLALQMGHRLSIDIELFAFNSPIPNNIQSIIFDYGLDIENISLSESIQIFRINGIKVDFVNYPYPWLSDCIAMEGIRLASIEDIAAMKMAAITNRGTKKDFIDIYLLFKHFSFKRILKLYHKKYPEASDFLLFKSFVYFDDAEQEPMPEMLMPITWAQIKKRIFEISEQEFL